MKSEHGFLSFAGLLLALLIVSCLAYFLMKSRLLEPPVSQSTAASLHEAGIRTENYRVLMNSVQQQVSDINQRLQADAEAMSGSLK